MKIYEALEIGHQILKKKNIITSSLDTEILLGKILKKKREYLILNPTVQINQNQYFNFLNLIEKRSFNEPIAYLINIKFFWKYKFFIDKKVLIPRPDTELIIEEFLKYYHEKSKINLLDIGVGSGCILLSLLKERLLIKGIGIDISNEAIKITKINSKKLGIKHRVKLFKTDIDKFNLGKYDVIVSNPPYINKYNYYRLDRDVLDFEPKSALYGGLEGTEEISKVIKKASKLIRLSGRFFLEIGYDQKAKVISLLKQYGFYINKVIQDLNGHDRCIISTKIW